MFKSEHFSSTIGICCCVFFCFFFLPWEAISQWGCFWGDRPYSEFSKDSHVNMWNYFEDILPPPLLLEQTVLNYLSLCKVSWTSANANIFNLWKDSIPIFSFCIFSSRGIFPLKVSKMWGTFSSLLKKQTKKSLFSSNNL